MPTSRSVCLLLVSALASPAAAEFLTIENASFEAIGLIENGFLQDVPGWVRSGDSGTFNPGPSLYPGGVPDGNNVAYSAVGGPWISQVLAGTVEAGELYELSIEVGRRTNITFWPGYVVELLADGQVLASDNSSVTPALGEFEPVVLSYAAPASGPEIGEAFEIRFRSLGPQVNFDAVSLQRIPEPVGAALALLALTGVAARRQRV